METPFEYITGPRYGQKLKKVRKWLHSDAVRGAGRDLMFQFSFCTIFWWQPNFQRQQKINNFYVEYKSENIIETVETEVEHS